MFTDQVLHTDYSGKTWIPLQNAVQSLGLRMKDSGNAVQIGYTDPMYKARLGQEQASSLGKTVQLKEAPIRVNGQLYLTSDSLSSLLHTNVKWNQRYHRIEISPLHDDSPPNNKTPEKSLRIASTSADTGELISYAKTFLGVPYDFGAEPYEQSKKFDCSTFTQHVFKKFNVDLPRLARDQGKEGRDVKRDNLKPGDLIFFTVPDRFESNAIPGHVGIFIGDGKFIHTWGKPGVQISNLDTGYWSNVILFMRSVL
ncbi:C40 family peptidase [Paenibacillus glacialis]|nr:C40 family peptidase [Paenibacillus glacialis]